MKSYRPLRLMATPNSLRRQSWSSSNAPPPSAKRLMSQAKLPVNAASVPSAKPSFGGHALAWGAAKAGAARVSRARGARWRMRVSRNGGGQRGRVGRVWIAKPSAMRQKGNGRAPPAHAWRLRHRAGREAFCAACIPSAPARFSAGALRRTTGGCRQSVLRGDGFAPKGEAVELRPPAAGAASGPGRRHRRSTRRGRRPGSWRRKRRQCAGSCSRCS